MIPASQALALASRSTYERLMIKLENEIVAAASNLNDPKLRIRFEVPNGFERDFEMDLKKWGYRLTEAPGAKYRTRLSTVYFVHWA